MKLTFHRTFFAGIAAVLALAVTGCSVKVNGSGTPTGTGPTTPTISIVLNGPSTVTIGTTSQYTATVSGTTNQSVTWAVNQIAGGNAQLGTISSTGLYTPPSTLPSSGNVSIQATSVADTNVSQTLSVIIQAAGAGPSTPVAVTVSGPSTVTLGTTGQFTATVTGTQNQSVTWSVNGTAGGSATTGTISSSGLFSPPASMPSSSNIVIGAASVATPTATGSLNAVLVAPVPVTATATAAARFLDQATFGPTAATISHVEGIGLQAALAEQFSQPPSVFSQPPFPQTECSPLSTNECETQSEFLKIAAFGNDQLRQRVAMALSEIWVAPNTQANSMPFYLNMLASDAFTNYRQIMQDVTLSPQMGFYLNMLNSGAAPAGQIANENYAREIMQLFAIGLSQLNSDGSVKTDANGNPLPAYTEAQVQAFARVFTGWTYANPDGSTPSQFIYYTPNWQHPMVAIESLHDESAKVVLNGTTIPAGQTAEQDLSAALDNIFAHPNVGPFVCRQLIQHLVTGDPSPAYVQRVAAVFADNGSGVRGDMKAIITAILMDPEARAADTQTGDQLEADPAVPTGGHLREPILWTVDIIRGLNATMTSPSDPYSMGTFMGLELSPLGQAPFEQPDVFNFFNPSYVVPQTTTNSPEFELENSGTIAPRLSRADLIVANQAIGLNVDLSNDSTSAIGQLVNNPAQMVDYLGMVFMHSQMPTDMRTEIINAITAIPADVPLMRAQVAVYLVVTSSQYKIMH